MKNLTYLLLSLCLLILTRCKHESIERHPDPDTKYFLSIDNARDIAKKLNLKNPYGYNEHKMNYRSSSNTITEESTVSQENIPDYYIFNYEKDQGFAIISADFRAMPVLGYSDNGNFNNSGDSINAGLASYLEDYISYVELLRDSVDYITTDIAYMWMNVGADADLLPDPVDLCEIEPDLDCEENDGPYIIPTTST